MSNPKPKSRPTKYPWKEWFTSKVPIVLKQGKNYKNRTYTFAVYAREVARKLGYTLTISVADDEKSLKIEPKKIKRGKR
jgi:hypothetical protein